MTELIADRNQWMALLRLEVPVIDEQHNHLLGLVCGFDPADPSDKARLLLMEILRYTREHFRMEEELMTEAGYPHLAGHRNLHDDLLKEAVRFAVRDLSSRLVRQEFHDFLRDWLTNHVLQADRALADFLRESRGSSHGAV